jgi:thiol-disulfide isomerase/thioredoxin
MALLTATSCSTAGERISGSDGVGATGSVVTVAPAERRGPVSLAGETLDGKHLDLAALRGHVVVVNYWASDCGPCRGEAPALAAAQRQLPHARFVGLDRNSDSLANARAFVRTFDIPYPSVRDRGNLILAFSGAVPATSIPSTIVLDERGRVAALVLGEVTTTLLVELVHDVEF